MDTRLDLHRSGLATQFTRRLIAAGQVVAGSPLPETVQELVRIRASQINGCGFCTDMHTKDALAAGETQQRLNLVAAWRDAAVFTEAERAALALTEEVRRPGPTSPASSPHPGGEWSPALPPGRRRSGGRTDRAGQR